MRLETLAGEYRDWLKKKYGTVARLNDVYDMGYKSMDAVPLPEEHPQENIALAKDWTEFVNTMGPEEIGLVRTAIADYRNFIENKYRKADKTVDYDKMSIDYKSAIRNKLEIPFYSRYPASPDECKGSLPGVCNESEEWKCPRCRGRQKNAAAVEQVPAEQV